MHLSRGAQDPAERSVSDFIGPGEAAVVVWLIERVLNEVPAELVQAALFGSVARREATPESDLDVLLIFRELPPDREPQASQAEGIAEEIAVETGVPVTVWSVSTFDLAEGNRTPMLVDALRDSVPVWVQTRPVPILPFTEADALRCAAALLRRVAEGSEEYHDALVAGRWRDAARRGRDDLVRLCTASLLLDGITRPRRAHAVREFRRTADRGWEAPPGLDAVLDWAIRSFGPTGRDEAHPVGAPPGGPRALGRTVDRLRAIVEEKGDRVYNRWNNGNGKAEKAPVLHPWTPEVRSTTRLRRG